MSLQEIINGLRAKILEVNSDIELFLHSPNKHVESLPFIVFDVAPATQNDYMGDVSSDPTALLFISFFSDAKKGSAALREIEESVHAALHRQEFTADNHSNTGTWNVERRNVELLDDSNILACVDVYTVFGSEN